MLSHRDVLTESVQATFFCLKHKKEDVKKEEGAENRNH